MALDGSRNSSSFLTFRVIITFHHLHELYKIDLSIFIQIHHLNEVLDLLGRKSVINPKSVSLTMSSSPIFRHPTAQILQPGVAMGRCDPGSWSVMLIQVLRSFVRSAGPWQDSQSFVWFGLVHIQVLPMRVTVLRCQAPAMLAKKLKISNCLEISYASRLGSCNAWHL